MAKLNYEKRNRDEKLRRLKGQQISKKRPKKITSKQIELMKKLGLKTDKNMNRATASQKISEALKSV